MVGTLICVVFTTRSRRWVDQEKWVPFEDSDPLLLFVGGSFRLATWYPTLVWVGHSQVLLAAVVVGVETCLLGEEP